jgi:hypothetical protein
MSTVQRRFKKIAVDAGTAVALLLLVPLSVGDSAVAQRRSVPAAQTGRAPACFDACSAQCRSTGGSGGTCSRTCYGRCSGVYGDIENRH